MSDFLRERLLGVENDAFALEIARLSLTVADEPNSNGWLGLKHDDMFAGDYLESTAALSTVLLTNPPYEEGKRRTSWTGRCATCPSARCSARSCRQRSCSRTKNAPSNCGNGLRAIASSVRCLFFRMESLSLRTRNARSFWGDGCRMARRHDR